MISVILPIRNEYPQATWTVYSYVNDIQEFDDFEIILVENACNRENLQWLEWFGKCSMARKGFLKVLHSEKPGVWPAMDMGFEEAKGDILIWSCSHIAVHRGSVPAMVNLLRKEGGICHSPMLWMGDYTSKREDFKSKLYSYKHPLNRGWSWTKPWTDRPFTTHTMGGGMSAAVQQENIDFKGLVEPNMTISAGGETYMDLKWWLLGSKVWIHPDALYYHWAYKREWRGDELTEATVAEGGGANRWELWNNMIAYYCLGGEELLIDRFGDEKMEQSRIHVEFYEKIKIVCKESRDFILKNQVYDGFFDLLEKKPWDHPE